MVKQWKVVGLILTLAILAGCGHHDPAVNTDAAAQGKAFITQLKTIPATERQDYIKDHPEGLKSVMASRDRSLIDQFQGVIRSGR